MLEELQERLPLTKPSSVSLAATRLTPPLLTRVEQHALESVASPARAVRAGMDLLREGEAADQLYVIITGWACRYKTMRDGSRQIVALLVPGDVANLDTLMIDRPGYGVRAVTAAKVVPIPRERVMALANEQAGIARALTRLALIENTILSQWALCLGRQSAQQRLAHLLCELAVRLAGDEDDTSSFEFPLTQEQLADALGLTSVHVNRTMQQLRSDGLVSTASRCVTLSDVPQLRNRAEFDPAYLHIGMAGMVTGRDRSTGNGRSSSPATTLV